MIRKICFFVTMSVSACFLLSCGSEPKKIEQVVKPAIARGDVYYGGTFRVPFTDGYRGLFPRNIVDNNSGQIASQLYEGLLKFNLLNFAIEPALAERWDVDSTALVYTFHLTKNAYFHDDPCFPSGKGRALNAQDVKYSFELLCTKAPGNYGYSYIQGKIRGAQKYYDASAGGKPSFSIEGINVIDDSTVSFVLEHPASSFLYLLCNAVTKIIPREAVEKYGDKATVGTGPFIFLNTKDTSLFAALVRNPRYHEFDKFGNRLPYLDSVLFVKASGGRDAINKFLAGNAEVVLMPPPEFIKDFVATNIAAFQGKSPRYVLERISLMQTSFLGFVTQRGVFKNVKVRQAFNYAIDKQKIVNASASNQAYGPAIYGLSPPSLPGYDIRKIKGYEFNPKKARALLAEAGYPEGKGFPSVLIDLGKDNVGGAFTGLEIQKQLKEHLNINADIAISSFQERLENAKYARVDMFNMAWSADYPSPENFLNLLYGKHVPASLDEPSVPNLFRYVNPKFDELFEKGASATSREESLKYFMKAEQIAVNDAPFVLLWYDENYRLTQGYVRNFPDNPTHAFDFTQVFFQPSKSGTVVKKK